MKHVRLTFIALLGLTFTLIALPRLTPQAKAQNSPEVFSHFLKQGIRILKKQQRQKARRRTHQSYLSRTEPRLTRRQIATLQRKLNSLGFSVGRPTGRIGRKTRRAIKRFQATIRAQQTAYLTVKQARFLISGAVVVHRGQRPSNTTENQQRSLTDHPPLTRSQTRNMQRALLSLGYKIGTADGKAGRKTGKAVSSYLRARGLDPYTTSPQHALELTTKEARAQKTATGAQEYRTTNTRGTDCRKSLSTTEYAICSSPKIRSLDNQLNKSYALARQAGDAGKIRREQKIWLRNERSSCGNDEECLMIVYKVRISELSQVGKNQDRSFKLPKSWLPSPKIQKLQTALASLGYYSGKTDGHSDTKTSKALTKYLLERNHDLDKTSFETANNLVLTEAGLELTEAGKKDGKAVVVVAPSPSPSSVSVATPNYKLSGKITEGNNRYSTTISFVGSKILVEYPSYPCGGKWTLIKQLDNIARYRETITHGSGCANNGYVTLTRKSASTVLFEWRRRSPTGSIEAKGLLSRI